MTEPNFDCPEFPAKLSIREAVMMEQGCDGWAAGAIAEMYARDRMADLSIDYFFATDPQALISTGKRWLTTIAANLSDLNQSMCRTTAAMMNLADAIRESEAAELAEHPDLALLNLQLDGYYDTP